MSIIVELNPNPNGFELVAPVFGYTVATRSQAENLYLIDGAIGQNVRILRDETKGYRTTYYLIAGISPDAFVIDFGLENYQIDDGSTVVFLNYEAIKISLSANPMEL